MTEYITQHVVYRCCLDSALNVTSDSSCQSKVSCTNEAGMQMFLRYVAMQDVLFVKVAHIICYGYTIETLGTKCRIAYLVVPLLLKAKETGTLSVDAWQL